MPPDDNDQSNDTHEGGGSDDDEDPRPPMKRRKKAIGCTTNTTTPPSEHHPRHHLRRRRGLTESSRGSPETSDATRYRKLSRDGLGDAAQSSRSPSAARESITAAEFQEWPFQGILKCTTIGNEIMYNWEFKLPRVSGYTGLPINPATLGISFPATVHSPEIHLGTFSVASSINRTVHTAVITVPYGIVPYG
jgi:hypothetical protein